MNPDEAKRILQAWRPDSVDAGDPLFAEARALAETNTDLREWYAREQAVNRRLAAAAETIAAPADLRARILKGGTRPPDGWGNAASNASNQRVRRPRSTLTWWGLAAAAAVAIYFAAGHWLNPKQPVADSALAAFAIDDASRPKTHGGHGKPEAELKATLKQATTRLGTQSPDFVHLRESGCRNVKLEGRDVLEVCFRRDGLGLHYYIARREDFPQLAAPSSPQVVGKPNANLVVWADATHFYIVVTSMEQAALQKLL